MAELFDKIIQDGRVSFVPRSNKTRAFWNKYNAKIAGSSNAQKETVTWQPATEEEMKELREQQTPSAPLVIPATPLPSAEIEALKTQLFNQQKLIEQLLSGALQPAIVESQSADQQLEPAKEKGKPGPKPKDNTNGENKETNTTQA